MDPQVSTQHKDLENRWKEMSVCEQMANIGSEVSRALNWKNKGKDDLAKRTIIRALELVDFSLYSSRPLPTLKEFTRLREALVDYFFYSNEFRSSEALWRKYFDHFAYAVRKN